MNKGEIRTWIFSLTFSMVSLLSSKLKRAKYKVGDRDRMNSKLTTEGVKYITKNRGWWWETLGRVEESADGGR